MSRASCQLSISCHHISPRDPARSRSMPSLIPEIQYKFPAVFVFPQYLFLGWRHVALIFKKWLSCNAISFCLDLEVINSG